MKTVFLDTETTGLEVESGDRVIEVGAVAYDGREKISDGSGTFQALVDPGYPISAGAARVHGLTDKDVAGKPKFAEIASTLLDFLRGAELVMHNAKFDLDFLNMELSLAGLPAVEKTIAKIIDTMEIARKKYRGSNSLDALCLRCGIDVVARRPKHSAMVDAELLGEVYLHMTGGQRTLDFEPVAQARLAELDAGPVKVVRLPESPEAAKLHEQYLARFGLGKASL